MPEEAGPPDLPPAVRHARVDRREPRQGPSKLAAALASTLDL